VRPPVSGQVPAIGSVSPMNKAAAALAALAFVTTGILAGCSSSDEASPAASSSMVGGMTTCDDATILKAVQQLQAAEDPNVQVFRVDDLNCADGWAVVQPTVGTSEDTAVTYTQIFQAEGQFWIPKASPDVCGSIDDNDMTAYPADAQIPEALYAEGCTTN